MRDFFSSLPSATTSQTARQRLKRAIIRRFAQVWLVLLIAGSLQPGRPGPVVAMHRGIHFLGFGGATFLLLLLSANLLGEIRAFLAMFLLGLSLEYLQHIMYHNVMEWWDVRDDAFAILAAWALYRVVWLSGPTAKFFQQT